MNEKTIDNPEISALSRISQSKKFFDVATKQHFSCGTRLSIIIPPLANPYRIHDLLLLMSRSLSLQLATLFSHLEICDVFKIRYPRVAMET